MEVELDTCTVLPAEAGAGASATGTDGIKQTEAAVSSAAEQQTSSTLDGGGATSSALQLNKPTGLSLEDPVKMMDSILNESGAISQNINLLGK